MSDPWLADLWPTWPEAWIVHSDEHILVIDKPAGMAGLPTDRSTGADALSRLRSRRGASSDGEERPPLGVHPLDRLASGLMVFGRSRAATRALATQLERGWWRRYLVALSSLGELRDSGLDHRILARQEGRQLVELSWRARRQPVRAELAKLNAPIAGDLAQGGPPAWRLMLHVTSLRLTHPASGEPTSFTSPPPSCFDDWLHGGADGRWQPPALAATLRAAAHSRYALATDPSVTAFRMVHGAGDFLPGVEVDRYEDHLTVSLTGEAVAHREAIVDALDGFGPQGIYLKLPPRQASTLVDTRREEIAPRLAVRGISLEQRLRIREGALEFAARLGDGLATGVFLDQRDNRARVAELAADAKVLNLFGYAGAFTVAAIMGGATASVTVDSSRAALQRAEQNLAAVGAATDRHRLVCTDAFTWLRRCAKRGERFDLVVLDPPSFATTKRSRFRADRDYRGMATAAIRCLEPGGRLLACTNHRGITPTKLRRDVTAAAEDARRPIGSLTSFPPPVDFPAAPDRGAHLKTLLLELDDR